MARRLVDGLWTFKFPVSSAFVSRRVAIASRAFWRSDASRGWFGAAWGSRTIRDVYEMHDHLQKPG